MDVEVTQYAVYWANLDPTIGSEINKTRPCVVISPVEMNKYLKTVIIAPVTHTVKSYPTRINCSIKGEPGSIMLDQIGTIDKKRLANFISKLADEEIERVKNVIKEMFC